MNVNGSSTLWRAAVTWVAVHVDPDSRQLHSEFPDVKLVTRKADPHIQKPFSNHTDLCATSGSMLCQRLLRWPSIDPDAVQGSIFAGLDVWQVCAPTCIPVSLIWEWLHAVDYHHLHVAPSWTVTGTDPMLFHSLRRWPNILYQMDSPSRTKHTSPPYQVQTSNNTIAMIKRRPQ